MNKKSVLCVMLTQTALLYANNALAQGQIDVTGRILDNTCIVAIASQNQTVKMETEGHKAFFRPGDMGAANPFQVVLQRCGTAATAVTLSFQGTEVPGKPQLLAVPSGVGNAEGLGIGLYEEDGTAIVLNGSARKYPLQGGEPQVELNYIARYVSVSVPVRPGRAAASVIFTHTYD